MKKNNNNVSFEIAARMKQLEKYFPFQIFKTDIIYKIKKVNSVINHEIHLYHPPIPWKLTLTELGWFTRSSEAKNRQEKAFSALWFYRQHFLF